MVEGTYILVIDDNEDDQIILRMALKKAGVSISVLMFSNYEEAIRYLDSPTANRLPCLIFADHMTPGMTGFEFLRWLRQQPKLLQLPVVFMSGSPRQGDEGLALAAGANLFLAKPNNYEQMATQIKAVCQQFGCEPG